jgi:CheY-like chemotaxis protein
MARGNDPPRENAIRAQEAVVRALTEELGHLDPESPAAASVRTQLNEESGRLAFRAGATGDVRSEATASVSAHARVTRKRSRVLIVDDNDGTRTALIRWLRGDYEVIAARDGEEGFSVAMASEPDVIVTDLWMPRVDGISMIERLRRTESMRSVPVIFVTGHSAAERIHGVSEGVIAYLPKPVDLDALENALRSALTQPRSN